MKIKVDSMLTKLLLVLAIAQTTEIALAENDPIPGERLTGKIDYLYVGHLGRNRVRSFFEEKKSPGCFALDG